MLVPVDRTPPAASVVFFIAVVCGTCVRAPCSTPYVRVIVQYVVLSVDGTVLLFRHTAPRKTTGSYFTYFMYRARGIPV